ncbi:MAG: hypothetical protein H6721_27970 [Sandaracinus sp.]|nr:hypothetical protein [Sandaracinus sp.]
MTNYKQQRRVAGENLLRSIITLKAPTEAEIEHFGDVAIYADVQSLQTFRWLQSAVFYAERVAAGNASDAEDELFWIRVAGVLLDIRKRQSEHLSFFDKVFGDQIATSRALEQTRRFVEAIDELIALLPEDERHYLVYRRHCACHPIQSAYRTRLRKGSLADVRSPNDSASMPQDVSEDMLRAVLRRYGRDEREVGRAIAARVLHPLRIVARAGSSLFGAVR